MNTALNRTTLAFLTNKSGGDLAYGDVVVLDNSNANGFTTTTTAALATRGLGVIFDVAGIANNATGAVAIGGWCPQLNLNTAATVGQFVKTYSVAGQGTPHDAPQATGDFAVALSASATPAALLFGSANPPSGPGSGTIVQIVNTETGAVATGTTTVPNDDSIPQNTEGTEFMTLAVTPTASGNNLKIDVVFMCSVSASAGTPVVALFQDTTADALAAAWTTQSSTGALTIGFSHVMAAGTTSATTFKVRAGPVSAATLTFNGAASARRFGGVLASSITITEYVP